LSQASSGDDLARGCSAASLRGKRPTWAMRRWRHERDCSGWTRGRQHCPERRCSISADEELRALAARHARWTEASIRELLDSAVELGQLAASDTPRLARAVQAAWNGALIQWAIRGRGSLGAWIAAVVDTLLEPHVVAGRLRRDEGG
jgi:hypothetical protein